MIYENIPIDLEIVKRDARDYTLDMFSIEDTVYPNEYTLPIKTPVLNQGYTSMCLDFTYRTIEEIQYAYNTGEYKKFASGFRYGQKMMKDYEGMLEAFEVDKYVKGGIPPADIFYVVGKTDTCYNYFNSNVTDEIIATALLYRNRTYITVDNADEIIKSLINFKSPGYVGVNIYSSFYKTGKDGIVPSPIGDARGAHAMTIVGVKIINNEQHLIVKNSWGSDWGDKGYCYIAMSNPIISNMRMFCDATPENEVVEISIGSKIIKTLKGDVEIDVAPFIKDERTFVPLRFVSEILGYDVAWKEASGTEKQGLVTISREVV